MAWWKEPLMPQKAPNFFRSESTSWLSRKKYLSQLAIKNPMGFGFPTPGPNMPKPPGQKAVVFALATTFEDVLLANGQIHDLVVIKPGPLVELVDMLAFFSHFRIF
jgi:hypothetical protein